MFWCGCSRTNACIDNISQKNAVLVSNELEITASQAYPTDYLVAFKALWVDQGFQRAMEKGNEYALHDNLL